MTVHLLKLCVGISSVEELDESQKRRLAREGRLIHRTRHTPRRADEILDGGSIYWIIKGFALVRQRIIGIERMTDGDSRPYCALHRDPQLVRTVPQPRRPHQGWRYLELADAPADMGRFVPGQGEPPPEMAAELRELGLI